MRTGTVIRASRRQIGIQILWDGDEWPSDYRHDDVVNRAEGMTDLLDGRGVSVGMRVESAEGKLRLTGETRPSEPSDEHRAPSSDKSPEQLHAAAMRGTNQDRIDRFFSAQGPPIDPDNDEELLYGK